MSADKKYTELTPVSAIVPSNLGALADVDANTTYSWTFAQLLTFLSDYGTNGANITFGTGSIPLNTFGANGDVYIKTNTGQFAQKQSGIWTVVYTIVQGVIGSTIYYGSGIPASGTGINGDTFVRTDGGIFYTKIAGTWTAQFTMATGPAGARGNSVLNGSVDPINTVGTNGDFYLNTVSEVLFGPKASGAWPGSGMLLKGVNGNTILNGITNPSNTLGVYGDFYLNVSNYTLFGPKSSGAWPTGISLFAPGSINPVSFPFTASPANPLQITTWVTDYFTQYGNGTFKVRLKNDDGSLQDRPDIGITRLIDRTIPLAPVQTGISLDTTGFPAGDIIIYYSNEPLI